MKTILVDALGTYVIKDEGVYKPLHDLLETYPNKKIVLTLADSEKMRQFGLDTLPYEVFTTSFNPMKNDPEYYKQVLKTYNLTSEDVVYFEHDKEAVKTAESVGIVSHHYDEDKKDVETLKSFLDSNL
jgi:HAD superfamily hydrolase (TIGR01509 family)